MADLAGAVDVIRLHGLGKRYGGRTVVDNVDLAVREGERFALLGHNGAGKTTLIKLMLGLCRPSCGEIEVQGRRIDGAGGLSLNIGYLPENVSFHDSMTGAEVVRFYARLKRRSGRECDELLDRVGLSAAAGRRVRTYSKGMRQRLGLAQALLGEPPLMLLDEPTTGLDPALQSLFYEIIGSRAAAGATALISSHALTEIEASVDRVAILSRGALVACGTLDDLRRAAGLPTTIRVRVAQGGAAAVADRLRGQVAVTGVNDSIVDLSCVDSRKVDVLKQLGGLDDPILDIDIAPVRLERLYKHFVADEGGVG